MSRHISMSQVVRENAVRSLEDEVIASNSAIRSYTRTVDDAKGASTTLKVYLEAMTSSSLCFGVNQPCTGHAVWFAAENMSNFLQDRRYLFESRKGLRVLELGAGPGLAGIWLAKFLEGGKNELASFLMTDGDEDVVKLLRRNCERNMLWPKATNDDSTRHSMSNVNVDCRPFLWGRIRADELLFQEAGFDVILGADLIYGRSDNSNVGEGTLVANLFDTVQALLLNSESLFYLGFTRRDLPVEHVLDAANQRGLVWELQDDYVYDIFDNNTDGQTCFWRDAIYSFRRGNGAAQSKQQEELRLANE